MLMGMAKAFATFVSMLTPKRRWVQFSLMTMFAVVTVLSMWLAVQVNRAHRRRDALDAIKDCGGLIEYDDELRSSNAPWQDRLLTVFGDDEAVHVVSLSLPSNWDVMSRKFSGGFSGQLNVWDGPLIDDDGLRNVARLTSLKELDLAWTDIGDDGVAQLQDMTNLRSLVLHYTNVTDKGLPFLAGMCRLDSLDLSGTQISDRGLASLQPLANLTSLSLHSTSVTGKGIKHLAGMSKLESLQLAYTKVGDDGLDSLARLASLKVLDIRYTVFSDEGRSRLAEALPNCSISYLPP